ncbi:hypothetical protein R3P38DRAFT_3262989 [Favolaschia claudopus]|uniref:Uncharacterized protein n=1 Tax=Favolaschia claudopus TaxID=2862362 RepID=A0AAW0CGN9_9AGAR
MRRPFSVPRTVPAQASLRRSSRSRARVPPPADSPQTSSFLLVADTCDGVLKPSQRLRSISYTSTRLAPSSDDTSLVARSIRPRRLSTHTRFVLRPLSLDILDSLLIESLQSSVPLQTYLVISLDPHVSRLCGSDTPHNTLHTPTRAPPGHLREFVKPGIRARWEGGGSCVNRQRMAYCIPNQGRLYFALDAAYITSASNCYPAHATSSCVSFVSSRRRTPRPSSLYLRSWSSRSASAAPGGVIWYFRSGVDWAEEEDVER